MEPISTIFAPIIVVASLAAIECIVTVEALSTISLVTIAVTEVVIAVPRVAASAACTRAINSMECNWTCTQARDCPPPSTSAEPMSTDSDICWNIHSPSSPD